MSTTTARLGIGVGLALVCIVRGAFSTDRAMAQTSSILWFAGHEQGNLSEWYADYGGAEVNSGDAISFASSDVAHTGRYSVKATIHTPPAAGVRLFRVLESRTHQQLFYSAWYYFPQVYRPVWWNIFQFKSRPESSGPSDPFWAINVGNRPDGTMYLYLQWWGELWTLRGLEGPHRGEFGWYAYRQTIKDVPAGRWVHIEAFLRQSADFDGQIIIWQDGVELVNQNNVRTRYPFGPAEWSINNYSESVSPSPATIYFDDAAISTSRLGSGAPRPPTNVRVIR